MAAEARCVLNEENYGKAIDKMIKYDSTKPARIGLVGTKEPCKCKRRLTAEKWINKLMLKKPKSKKVA